MPLVQELVRRNLEASAGMQQRGRIQGGLKMREYFVGQKVRWYYPPSANQKLKYPWTGPFEVTDVAGDCIMGLWPRFMGPRLIIEDGCYYAVRSNAVNPISEATVVRMRIAVL